jgi:diphthamide synthase subunit DPH2
MKEELGEEKYIEFIKNMNKQSYEKKKINSDKPNGDKQITTTTERVKKHYDKMKEELGEEKYIEFIKNMNKQSYEKKKINSDKPIVDKQITTTTERVKKHYDKMKEELGEEKYIEFIKNMNKQSYEKKKINSDKPIVDKQITTTTERVKKHYDKMKKELGEEKYIEFIKNRNKQSYEKKKINSDKPIVDKQITTITERVKKHYDKMKEELGEEKYIEFIKNRNKQSYEKKKINSDKVTPHTSGGLILPTNFSYFQNPPSFCINKYIDKKRITTRYTLRSKNIQKEFDDFINIVNLKFPQLNIQPYKIPGLSESLSPENLSKPVMPSNFSICVVNGADHIQFCKKIHDKQQLHRTKINSHDLQVELDKFIDKLNDKFGLKLEKTNYKIINTNGWQTTNKFNIEIDL